MKGGSLFLSSASFLLLLSTLPARVLASQILKTNGFTSCMSESTITVNAVDIEYDNGNQSVTFQVSGTSTKVQNVTAALNVTAYGISVYSNSFNPCATATFVSELCPVPSGTFSATGVQTIPSAYANMVPSIAFSVPDIDAQATLELKNLDTGDEIACLDAEVTNGKTVSVPAVSYAAAAVAAVALVGTSVAAVGALAGGGSSGGAGTTSPSFGEIIGVFQGFAMNGMMSVNYPTVYRSFAKNFAFSTGIVPITSMQISIDNFRSKTGGNLTNDNVQFLQNATLAFSSNTDSTKRSLFKRAMEELLLARDSISTSASGNTTSANTTTTSNEVSVIVSGIQGYAEQLSVPQANTFMTVLIIVAIIVAAIAVGILAFKLILEVWSLFGSFPKGLTGFRKHYWGTMARSIIQCIIILYGTWVLVSIWEFTNGDSWAAKLLAGVTLAIFTGVLAFFTFRIWQVARRAKKTDGDTSALYYDKKNWIKYSIFYDSYKKDFWWLFVPAIAYTFAKGCTLALANGHGFAQTIAHIVLEVLMLGILLWNRPYERRSGNVINIFIQVIRVLSVFCLLLFVEELGISETTSTIAGVVLLAIQAVLTGSLAILICVNAIIVFVKTNPHRKRRKEAEKLNRDLDNLTPLDARNSLLLLNPTAKDPHHRTGSLTSSQTYTQDVKAMSPLIKTNSNESFDERNAVPLTSYRERERDLTPQARSLRHLHTESMDNLVESAAPLDGTRLNQQPTLPRVQGYGGGYRGMQY